MSVYMFLPGTDLLSCFNGQKSPLGSSYDQSDFRFTHVDAHDGPGCVCNMRDKLLPCLGSPHSLCDSEVWMPLEWETKNMFFRKNKLIHRWMCIPLNLWRMPVGRALIWTSHHSRSTGSSPLRYNVSPAFALFGYACDQAWQMGVNLSAGE